jgi:hypothetical protein
MSAAAPVPAVLDEAVDVVRLVAAPWVGVLVLLSLPLRLMEAQLLARALYLGDRASDHATHLQRLAAWTLVAFVVAVAGRTVYARACTLALGGSPPPGWTAFRVRAADLGGHLLLALALLVLAAVGSVTVFAVPVAAVLSYLAAAACQGLPRLDLASPLAALGRASRRLGGLVAVLGVLSVGGGLVLANLHAAAQLGLWLAGAFGLRDVSAWAALASLRSEPYVLALVALTVTILEPFFVAASCVLVRHELARGTGEDLRHRARRLWRREAA